jgi:hypothetical protein
MTVLSFTFTLTCRESEISSPLPVEYPLFEYLMTPQSHFSFQISSHFPSKDHINSFPQNMSSIQYIPSSAATYVGDIKILRIYACGYEPTDLSSEQSTGKAVNHWAFHCAISEDNYIRIDPSPSADLSLVVIVSPKNYLPTDNAAKTLTLTTTDLTVGGFINLLVTKKYDKYQFTQNGVGCRYWVSCVMKLLRTEGKLTDDTEIQAVNDAIRITWGSDQQPLPAHQQTPIEEGRFFALSE